jgi:hypothetical protein
MIKTVLAISISASGLALAACAGMPTGGQNMNGFPVDPACMSFYGDDPFYKGNKALAYATNCSGAGDGSSR